MKSVDYPDFRGTTVIEYKTSIWVQSQLAETTVNSSNGKLIEF